MKVYLSVLLEIQEALLVANAADIERRMMNPNEFHKFAIGVDHIRTIVKGVSEKVSLYVDEGEPE